MDSGKISCYTLLIISIIAILAALFIEMPEWLIYLIAIICIPLFVMTLGLITMAKPRKEDKEERVKEPFTGY